jgi:hypothetical protein
MMIITRNDVGLGPAQMIILMSPPHVVCKASPQLSLLQLFDMTLYIVMRCQPVVSESHSCFWVGLERI